MVKILNGKLCITPFGVLTYQLYLSPGIAYWVRGRVAHLTTWEGFLTVIMYVYEKERGRSTKADFRGALDAFMTQNNPDFFYALQQVGDQFKIYPGDMEELIEGFRWVCQCAFSIAELDQVQTVQKFAECALTRLSPPAPPSIQTDT